MKSCMFLIKLTRPALCLALVALIGACAPTAQTTRDNIFRAIESEPNFGPHQITVDTRGGLVTLSGEVSSQKDKLYVYNAARSQPGVVEVRDYLRVHGMEDAGPSAMMSPSMVEPPYISTADRELVLAIEQNLLPLSASHDYHINIVSRDGYVTVTGTAGSTEDAEAVLQAMRATSGVKGVTSRIDIIPGPSDTVILNNLRSAIASDPEAKLQGLDYEVRDGVVTFTGKVNNHRDIDRLLSIALMVPGVKAAKSNVTITR